MTPQCETLSFWLSPFGFHPHKQRLHTQKLQKCRLSLKENDCCSWLFWILITLVWKDENRCSRIRHDVFFCLYSTHSSVLSKTIPTFPTMQLDPHEFSQIEFRSLEVSLSDFAKLPLEPQQSFYTTFVLSPRSTPRMPLGIFREFQGKNKCYLRSCFIGRRLVFTLQCSVSTVFILWGEM